LGECNHDLPNNASEQNLHFVAQKDMFLRPKDSHLALPITTIQGDHTLQLLHISLHPMGIDSP
jgi:hypothetical protein